MNILIISRDLPSSQSPNGEARRVFHFIRILSRKHDISLISFIKKEDLEYSQEVKKLCKSVDFIELKNPWWETQSRIKFRLYELLNAFRLFFSSKPQEIYRYKSVKMLTKINEIMASTNFDLVHFNTLAMAQYAFGLQKNVPTFYIDNGLAVEDLHRNIKSANSFWEKIGFRLCYRKMRVYLSRLCSAFDAIASIREEDKQILKSLRMQANVMVVSHGIDTSYFKPKFDTSKPNTIIFVGNLTCQPNVDAILYFCSAIFPTVKLRVPNVTFYIVGISPPESILELETDDNITVTGYVNDIRPYLYNSSVFVAPLRLGGGVRGKILEAMACGVPVISTSEGCKGITAKPDEDIVIADTADEFAKRTIHLLQNKDLRFRLSRNGYNLVNEKYDWEVIVKNLETVYEETVKTFLNRKSNEKRKN